MMRITSKNLLGKLGVAVGVPLALLCISQTNLIDLQIRNSKLFSRTKDVSLKGNSIFSTDLRSIPINHSLDNISFAKYDLIIPPENYSIVFDNTLPLPVDEYIDSYKEQTYFASSDETDNYLITAFNVPNESPQLAAEAETEKTAPQLTYPEIERTLVTAESIKRPEAIAQTQITISDSVQPAHSTAPHQEGLIAAADMQDFVPVATPDQSAVDALLNTAPAKPVVEPGRTVPKLQRAPQQAPAPAMPSNRAESQLPSETALPPANPNLYLDDTSADTPQTPQQDYTPSILQTPAPIQDGPSVQDVNDAEADLLNEKPDTQNQSPADTQQAFPEQPEPTELPSIQTPAAPATQPAIRSLTPPPSQTQPTAPVAAPAAQPAAQPAVPVIPTPPSTQSYPTIITPDTSPETLQMPAQNFETPAVPNQEEAYLIRFNNISIIEFLNFISSITKKNFIFNEEDLGFNVTIVSNELTTISNIMTALLQELRIHGLSLMEIDNNLIIHSNPSVNNPPVLQTGDTRPRDADLVTRVFRLSNTSPAKMAEVVRPLLSSLALLSAMPEMGSLVVTDLASNVDRIADLIRDLDSQQMGLEIGQYILTNTSLHTAVNIVGQILTPIAQGKVLVIIPDAGTNSIFVVSSQPIVQKAIDILSEIDIAREAPEYANENAIDFYTSNANTSLPPEDQALYEELGLEESAEYLSPEERAEAEALRQSIIRQGGAEALARARLRSRSAYERIKYYIYPLCYRPGDHVLDGMIKVAESLQGSDLRRTNLRNDTLIATLYNAQWLEDSNSIVVSGTVESIEAARRIIEQIDVPVRQVFIEMLILDTTVSDSLNYGVDWATSFSNPSSAGAEGFLSTGSPLPNILSNVTPGNVVNPLAPVTTSTGVATNGLLQGGTFSLGVIGLNIIHNGISYGNLGALITALHSDTRVNVIMNPKIIVEENTTAELFVGLNTQFQTQSIANNLGTILTSNVEYRDVGSTLKITPFITCGNIITMDIQQELTSEVNGSQLAGGGASGSTGSSTGTAVSTTASSTTLSPTTRKAKTTTRVHVPDNYFVIISGMIQDQDTYVRNQVPCLGGAPLLGAFFSQKKHQDEKRNLMIFINPHIINTPCDINHLTKRQQDIFKEKNLVPKRWQREVDEALDWMNVKPNFDPEYQRW